MFYIFNGGTNVVYAQYTIYKRSQWQEAWETKKRVQPTHSGIMSTKSNDNSEFIAFVLFIFLCSFDCLRVFSLGTVLSQTLGLYHNDVRMRACVRVCFLLSCMYNIWCDE